jgi:hypothetical protein
MTRKRYNPHPLDDAIAEKPFDDDQRPIYIGRKAFDRRDGSRQLIDVWRCRCTRPGCSRGFTVCAYHGSDPLPAHRLCPLCRHADKVAELAKAQRRLERQRAAAALAKPAPDARMAQHRRARDLARGRYEGAKATARAHRDRPTYAERLAVAADRWRVYAIAASRCRGEIFDPMRAARENLVKRKAYHLHTAEDVKAHHWRAFDLERATVALDVARAALGPAGAVAELLS